MKTCILVVILAVSILSVTTITRARQSVQPLSREEVREKDTCEKFYKRAEFYSERGVGHVSSGPSVVGITVTVRITTTETADIPSMGLYAEMYLACREHSR